MLQLQPDPEIVKYYISQPVSKFFGLTLRFSFIVPLYLSSRYLRALGAIYFRMTGPAVEVYQVIEPLYNDYRKLRRRTVLGLVFSFWCTQSKRSFHSGWELTHMDEFAEELLSKERCCDQILPRLPTRLSLELSVCTSLLLP